MGERNRCARMQITFMGKDADFLDVRAYLPPDSRMRAGRMHETSDAQKEYNNTQSAKKLRMLIKHNFSSGHDWFVTFTFGRKLCPTSYDGVQDVMVGYFESLRKLCKKFGLPLRWIYVIEIGKHGRYHVHAVINGEVPRDIVSRCWDSGRMYFELVADDTTQLDKLATYMSKAPVGKHSYHTSKTIEYPDTETDDGLMGENVLKAIAYDADYDERVIASVMEQLFPGYRYVHGVGYYCERLMSPYLYVEMERIRDKERRQEKYIMLGLDGFVA